MYGVTDLMKLVVKIRKINPELQLLGALLIRHDERQTVCKLIETAAREQIGKLLPVRIPSPPVPRSIRLRWLKLVFTA